MPRTVVDAFRALNKDQSDADDWRRSSALVNVSSRLQEEIKALAKGEPDTETRKKDSVAAITGISHRDQWYWVGGSGKARLRKELGFGDSDRVGLDRVRLDDAHDLVLTVWTGELLRESKYEQCLRVTVSRVAAKREEEEEHQRTDYGPDGGC